MIEIRHSETEVHRYRLQQCPRELYVKLLHISDPEVLMNQLLKMYLPEK